MADTILAGSIGKLLQAQKPKKERRFQFSEEGDFWIMKSLRLNPRQTVPQLVETTALLSGTLPRSLRVIQRRCQALRSRFIGYVQCTAAPQKEGGPRNTGYPMYYPTFEGWDYLLKKKELPREMHMGEKVSSLFYHHEIDLTNLWIDLFKGFAAAGWTFTWERLKGLIWEPPVNPDAYITVENDDFEGAGFIERERDTGTFADYAVKVNNYETYFSSGSFTKSYGKSIARVFFVFRNQITAQHFAEYLYALGGHYAYPRWFSTWDAALKEPTKPIFYAPQAEGEKALCTFFGEVLR